MGIIINNNLNILNKKKLKTEILKISHIKWRND